MTLDTVYQIPTNPYFQILLFYKYTDIEHPERLMNQQRAWCKELGLTGRILIGTEGINGTLEGTVEATNAYIDKINTKPEFADIHWKKSVGTGVSFPKLIVRLRNEVVATHLNDSDKIGPHRNVTGQYITPELLHEWIRSDRRFFIVDMRNDFEHQIGHFKDSILPSMLQNFRDLPKVLPLIQHLKNETIVTVCTGGIRCEKASGFLLQNEFNDVYQLQGGIVSYMEQYPNQDFLGKLYVFDRRLAIAFNTDTVEHVVVGKCQICGNQSENLLNYTLRGETKRRNGIICTDCVSAGLAREEQGLKAFVEV